MSLETINDRGLVLLGCGKMGSAMLEGWIANGITPTAVTILDPYPSDRLKELQHQGLNLNVALPSAPAICILAVKPQMMGEALPQISALGNSDTVFLSIAAGTPIATFETLLGERSKIIRAMPNTPAAVARGITALIGNDLITEPEMQMAEQLLQAVGQTVRLDTEDQMDAVTAVSGSGPAYVFHLIETLAAAGEKEGLPPDLAMALAKATVGGAGELAETSDESPTQLRINVTSPGGTTAAALAVLMDETDGFPEILRKGVKAAADRSRKLRD